MKNLTSRVVIPLLILFLVPAWAAPVRELNWDDLKPVIEYDDPFERLTPDQLFYLRAIARERQLQENGVEVSQSVHEEAGEARKILMKENVDIEGLFAKRTEVREMRRKRAESTVPELNGKTVIMPGFVLPLEYAGTKVTEFLLVPWIGACIHTPPPTANQIVHVVVGEDQARESKGLFEPVNVTGTMFTKRSTKNLFLVDGSAGIDIGYSMQANMVEPYENNKEQNRKAQPQG
jgi:hypothetical protein